MKLHKAISPPKRKTHRALAGESSAAKKRWASATSQTDETLERFQELKERWRRETAFISSPTDLFLHSAYQQIIGLGPDAIPLLLADLRNEPGLWFWALKAITGESPIPADFEGGTRQAADLWLEWGRRNGIEV